jgi:Methyltransferase FkbM domain
LDPTKNSNLRTKLFLLLLPIILIIFFNQVSYIENWSIGKISAIVNNSAKSVNAQPGKQEVMLQCIPITTLLLALNVTHVDYFSLDVEGHELDVLQTIDFDKFDITVR